MCKRVKTNAIGRVILFLLVLVHCSEAWSFTVPERLEYELSWLGVKAGDSALEITSDSEGVSTIVSTTQSVAWISVFYPVQDRVESVFIPKEQWVPVKYHLDQHEGSRRKDIEIRFSSDEGKALYIDHIEQKEREYDVPSLVFDPLSALYRVRKLDLVVGRSSYVTLFDSEKVYDLEIQVVRRETIKVPAGKFETILVIPILKSEGIFSREGPIYTWLSDDEKRVPVKLKTQVAVGSVTAELTGGSYWPANPVSADKDQSEKDR